MGQAQCVDKNGLDIVERNRDHRHRSNFDEIMLVLRWVACLHTAHHVYGTLLTVNNCAVRVSICYINENNTERPPGVYNS